MARTPKSVAIPEPAQVELSEEVKDEIRRAFKKGAMQTQLLARYGIPRETLLNILADCIDPNAGPDDETLDRIFGPLRTPGVTPDERGDASEEATESTSEAS